MAGCLGNVDVAGDEGQLILGKRADGNVLEYTDGSAEIIESTA